jgi:hypothetical protein
MIFGITFSAARSWRISPSTITKLEPNVNFTPDMKWIVFRSNMFGPTHVFAVEIAKANSTQTER